MKNSGDNLRLIFGLKVKQLRQQRGFSLKDLAGKTKLSISYLSEIEKGVKYPKPEKTLQLARALEVPFDELVTLKVEEELNPLTAILDSPLLKEFPFQLFGIQPRDVFALVKDSPAKAGALLRTLLDLGLTYDMGVEQFLFAALRSYQKMHQNYFAEIEQAAMNFREARDWQSGPGMPAERLQAVLEKEYSYIIDDTALANYPVLHGFRSIWLEGPRPKLLLNPKVLRAQRAFILGREIGYCHLGLKEHAQTSTWLKVESFEQVLNNFQASYFSGALLIPGDLLQRDLAAFFQDTRWDGAAFLQLMQRYEATPEMFLYRLSQLLPGRFNLHDMFYLRFNHEAGSEVFRLTKELNMSRVLVPHSTGLNEHYCRRWLSIRLLKELAERRQRGETPPALVGAQRSRFLDGEAEYFVITLARPLMLTAGALSSITLGFLMNDDFKNTVRFWDAPDIPLVEVNETCERCGLSEAACRDRVAPPTIYQQHQNQMLREAELQRLKQDLSKP